jgi:urease accessory protein
MLQGLLHPLIGFDHLALMVAVGFLSMHTRQISLPFVFVITLIMGAFAAPYVSIGFIEPLVLISLFIMSVMVLWGVKMSFLPLFIGFFGILHGIAHGAEAPDNAFALYIVGFTITSACLHFTGFFAAKFINAKIMASALALTGAVLVVIS